MTRMKSYLIIALLVSAGLAISGCHTMIRCNRTANPPVSEKHVGPPPHAPAHGYRHKNSDGVHLVYDSSIGVYVVVGHTDHYFCKEIYYRWHGASWQASSKIGKGWSPVSEKTIPPGLRKTHVCKKGK
jgi:hypothetical protein